jgi:hypothetical protein
MNRVKTLLAISLFALCVLPSCKKHNDSPTSLIHPIPPPVIPQTGPWLYVGGSINDPAQAAYWKISLSAVPPDTTAVLIPDASEITSIAVADTDVYMAGPSRNLGIYWKNGTAVSIPSAYEIYYIAVSGSNVYGYGNDYPGLNLAYWTNGIETSLASTLPQGVSLSYQPSGLTVSGSDVYASASLSFYFAADTTYYGNSAAYWKNGAINYLSDHGYGGIEYPSAAGIAVTATDVYVAGNIDIDADTMAWCGYWKDTTKITLVNRTGHYTYGTAYSIAVSGNDVYVTGLLLNNGTFEAVYWKNGAMTTLPNGVQATAIAFYGSDVYILGSDNTGNSVVWKNGALFVNLGRVVTTSIAAAK